MSNQPRAPQSTSSAFLGNALDRDEWELLVTLPRRVLMAAAAAEEADGHGAAEGIAGIEAIAAGLASTSALVREVVASIYSESHEEPVELLGGGDMLQTLAACRYASELVAGRCSVEDAEAYRGWLRHIAAVVSGVAQGMSGSSTGRVALVESRFLYALGGVLRP
jgi:hypothetical protein